MPRPALRMPTQSELEKLLKYDPATGYLTWRETRRTRKAGARAGHLDRAGYRNLTMANKRTLKAHRLIWKLVTGKEPKGTIDHKNGDRDDNRFENLREADMSQQNFNKNTRGYNKRGNAYQVRVTAYGVIKRQTVYTEEDAIRVRDEMRAELWGAFKAG
jgi:hypothetical protein